EQQLGKEGDPALRDQVAVARDNTKFLERLDKIRLDSSVWVEGRFNVAGALAEYPKAFLENGFDVLHGDPGELAARLNASEVRDYRLAALDEWAMAEGSVAEGGSVWGTDIYTDDSPLAAVAVHAGVLQVGQKGVVKVTILPGQQSYTGSTRNGVTTGNWKAW